MEFVLDFIDIHLYRQEILKCIYKNQKINYYFQNQFKFKTVIRVNLQTGWCLCYVSEDTLHPF